MFAILVKLGNFSLGVKKDLESGEARHVCRCKYPDLFQGPVRTDGIHFSWMRGTLRDFVYYLHSTQDWGFVEGYKLISTSCKLFKNEKNKPPEMMSQ